MKSLLLILVMLTGLFTAGQTGYKGTFKDGTDQTDKDYVFVSGQIGALSRWTMVYKDSTYWRNMYKAVRFDCLKSGGIQNFLTTDANGLVSATARDWYTKTETDGRYLQTYTELDPTFTASPAFGITSTNISNWNTAFSWGNPAGVFVRIADTSSMLSKYLRKEIDGSITNEIELPTQTGQNSKFLSTNGSTPAWTSLPGTNTATGYSSGTVYGLTTTFAKIDFGTTDPAITLPAAGTYIITSNVRIEYAAVTSLAGGALNFKLRRTNNTPADIPLTTTVYNMPPVTLLTQTAGDADVPAVIYTTANNNDVIELWGSRTASVTIGAVNVGEAYIIAWRIY